MDQQNIYPKDEPEQVQMEHKIIILYLVDKMDIPILYDQIAQFASIGNYMNHYLVRKYLTEMVEVDYLEMSRDNNNAERYSITEEGLSAIDIFANIISAQTKNSISKYVIENRRSVKKDFEVMAQYFAQDDSNEYTVKLGVYDDDIMLMEINMSVVSREQALFVCNNWKANYAKLYGQSMELFLTKSKTKK